MGNLLHHKSDNFLFLKSLTQFNMSNLKKNKIQDLKKKFPGVPSHFLFGIDEPIEFQCPNIDDYIEKVKSSQECLKKAFKSSNTDIKNAHIISAFFTISNLDEELDIITRDNFMQLREHAYQWKGLALRLLNDIEKPEKYFKIKWK